MPVIPVPSPQPFPPGSGGMCGWDIDPSDICPIWGDLTPAEKNTALNIAVMVMWAATGRQFGPCEITIRPCQSEWYNQQYRVYPVWASGGWGDNSGMFFPYLYGGQWYNSCGCGTRCCCRPHCQVVMHGPVAQIVEVLVHGEVVPSSEYRVDVAQGVTTLVKTSPGCWPTCQDFNEPADGDHAFAITYARGTAIPEAVISATEILACNFGSAVKGAACALPARMTSLTRQGVTAEFIQQATDIDQFTTGINEVDMVIRAVNPGRRVRQPLVLSPDLPEYGDRMTILGGP